MSAQAAPHWRLGALIPSYRHAERLGEIIRALRALELEIIVVDDGNAPETAAKIAALHDPAGGVTILRRAKNGGKGAAVKDGVAAALAAGWTHAFQIDADGQHDLSAVPNFLSLSKNSPNAVICGVPVYDETIPKARKIGREITHFWVRIETLSRAISDSLCGFRIYPLPLTHEVLNREYIGKRMDFDVEAVVHLYWRGAPIVEAPVRVTYPQGNVSNFHLLHDNVRISLMHTRLACQMPFRMPLLWWRRALKSKTPPPHAAQSTPSSTQSRR